jgi:hypothetical protein
MLNGLHKWGRLPARISQGLRRCLVYMDWFSHHGDITAVTPYVAPREFEAI